MKTLVTLPSQRSIDRLRPMFLSAPISIMFESLVLPLAHVSDDFAGQNDNAFYSGRFTQFTQLWDRARDKYELVGVVYSPFMRERATQLKMPDEFQFKLIFSPQTSNSYAIRHFVVSIADTLVLKEPEPFTFEREYVV